MSLLDWIRRRHPAPLPEQLRPGTTEVVMPLRRELPPELVDRLAAECAAVREVVAAYLYEAAGLAEHEEPHLALGIQLESEDVDYGRIEDLLERLAAHFGDEHVTVQVLGDELLWELQGAVPPFYERDAA